MKNIRLAVIVWAGVCTLLLGANPGYCSYYDSYFGYDSSTSDPIISLNVNEQDAVNSAFRIAAREGRFADLRDLLKHGAQVDSLDDDRNTALMNASMYCKPRVVQELLQAGAKVNLQNIHGETAMMLAVQQSCVAAVRLLIGSPGIDLLLKNHSGQRALDLAKTLSTDFVDGAPVDIFRMIASKPGSHYRRGRIRRRKALRRPVLGRL